MWHDRIGHGILKKVHGPSHAFNPHPMGSMEKCLGLSNGEVSPFLLSPSAFLVVKYIVNVGL